MPIKRDVLKRINDTVYKRYPEVSGKRPTIKIQKGIVSGHKAMSLPNTYILTYSKKISLGNSRTTKRVVRVVAKENGTIVKISASK